MNIDDVAFDSAKFSDVWNRVMGENSPESLQNSDETAKLRVFMDKEREAALHIAEISKRCCRCVDAVLSGVAGCDRIHFKALRARYFILTGERYCPPELCLVAGDVTEVLRSIYITKMQLTKDYEALGKSNEMYARLAEEEECTAEEIYGVIMKLLR